MTTARPALDLLRELFEAHEIPVVERDGWLYPHGRPPGARAQLTPVGETGALVSVQLDVQVYLGARYAIIESCGGFGDDWDGAVHSAMETFALGSFHVLLSAFWGGKDDSQVMVETWTVGGAPYRATIGNVTQRSYGGESPPSVPSEAFPLLQSRIQALEGDEEVYWVRMFFGNPGTVPPTTEVLLNNEPWTEVEAAVAALPWERPDTYYSARVFLALQRLHYPTVDEPPPPPVQRSLIDRLLGRNVRHA